MLQILHGKCHTGAGSCGDLMHCKCACSRLEKYEKVVCKFQSRDINVPENIQTWAVELFKILF